MDSYVGPTLREIRDVFRVNLRDIYEKQEVISIFSQLAEEYLGLSHAMTLLSLDENVTTDAYKKFEIALNDLKRHRPLQYILGKTEFCGFHFFVSEGVLIPRPETEELVEWIIEEVIEQDDSPSILDIGTGSGCIAITLKKRIPSSYVSCIDISRDALSCAGKNADLNETNISISYADILDQLSWKNFKKYDVIVSNPPYVRNLEKPWIRKNVLYHEPREALFVEDDDPLIFYRSIFEFAKAFLNKNGKLYLEINENMSESLREQAKAARMTVHEIRKDLRGKDRMVKLSCSG